MVVLDVRNDYEWDAGHFDGAERPAEEVFHETPVGQGDADVPEHLKGIDPGEGGPRGGCSDRTVSCSQL